MTYSGMTAYDKLFRAYLLMKLFPTDNDFNAHWNRLLIGYLTTINTTQA